MKKSLILFTILILGGIGFLSVFQASLLKEKDHVTFQDEILYGDADMAEGISVDLSTQYDRQLFWTTTYKAGEEPDIISDYKFYNTKHRAEHVTEESVYMNIDIETYYFDPEKKREELKGIDQALYDLYHDSPSLTQEQNANHYTKVRKIFLKDFYDFYPFYMGISLEGYDRSWNWMDDYYYESSSSEEFLFLQNFFKIPVIEDDVRMLNLQKDSTSFSSYVNYSDTDDPYYLSSFSAVTNHALYFMFTFDHNGEAADFDDSYIPGGYGIYQIPYETQPAKTGQVKPAVTVDIKATSMVYPLDKSIQIFNFATTADKTKLILVYQDSHTPDSCTEIAIIDAKTMETLQTITLEGIEQPDGSIEILIPYTLHVYDDFIASYCSSDYLAVMSLQDSGLYHLDYIVNIHDNPVFDYYIDSRGIHVMDMKDGKIAIVGLKNKSYGNHYYNESCGFYLAIFDKDGLIYYSEHDSSLDRGQYPYSNSTVQPLSYYENEKPLNLVWK